MARTQFESEGDHKILHMDFSGLTRPQEAIRHIEEAKAIVAAQPKNSLRVLLNVRGSTFNKEVIRAISGLAEHDKPYVTASAIVGVEGLMKFALDVVSRTSGRKFKVFDDDDSARQWLIEQP